MSSLTPIETGRVLVCYVAIGVIAGLNPGLRCERSEGALLECDPINEGEAMFDLKNWR